MDYTLRDVISHPTYMSHVLGQTDEDLQRMQRILFVVEYYEAVKNKYLQHGLKELESSLNLGSTNESSSF